MIAGSHRGVGAAARLAEAMPDEFTIAASAELYVAYKPENYSSLARFQAVDAPIRVLKDRPTAADTKYYSDLIARHLKLSAQASVVIAACANTQVALDKKQSVRLIHATCEKRAGPALTRPAICTANWLLARVASPEANLDIMEANIRVEGVPCSLLWQDEVGPQYTGDPSVLGEGGLDRMKGQK